VGFVSLPIWGTAISVIPGLTPPLYRVFFNDPQEGGIFEAWLTSSVKNLGELFVASQVVVTHGLWKMKRGELAGELAPFVVLFVLFVRFIF